MPFQCLSFRNSFRSCRCPLWRTTHRKLCPQHDCGSIQVDQRTTEIQVPAVLWGLRTASLMDFEMNARLGYPMGMTRPFVTA